MKGKCLCGAVEVETAYKPDQVNFCDCLMCAKGGAAWCYYKPEEVTITGDTRTYMRNDLDDPVLFLHSCPVCGTTTHWSIVPEDKRDIVGINIRLFDPGDIKGITAHYQDGRSWDGEGEAELRREDGVIGIDAFI